MANIKVTLRNKSGRIVYQNSGEETLWSDKFNEDIAEFGANHSATWEYPPDPAATRAALLVTVNDRNKTDKQRLEALIQVLGLNS